MNNISPSNWQKVQLQDVAKIKYGKDHKNMPEGSIPCLGSGGIMRMVNNYIYNKESVLVPRKGSLSNLFYMKTPFWTVDTLFYTEINKKSMSAKYFFYYLKNINLEKLKVGTGVPSLTAEILNDLVLYIAKLPEQNRIASVLSSLDDKIETNDKINKLLESIVKTLYDYWFVQFDFPNENGKPYKSSGGKMKHCPILKRDIPDNWTNSKIDNFIDIQSGYSFKSKDFVKDGGFGLVTISNVQDGKFITKVKDKLKIIPNNVPEYCKLKTGDILLSLTGNVGRVCFAIGQNYLLNQRVGKLVSKNKKHHFYTYLMFKNQSLRKRLIYISTGTAQKNLSPINTGDISFCKPSDNILELFNDKVSPMFTKIQHNQTENKRLAEIRDFLLPMLMNGQVRIIEK